MALDIDCSFCNKELTEPGGLLFDPPEGDKVRKRHICCKCMLEVEALSTTTKNRVMGYLIINGRTWNNFKKEISYEEVVGMAELKGTPTVVCTPDGDRKSFTLLPRTTIRTGKQMIFNVQHTGNA